MRPLGGYSVANYPVLSRDPTGYCDSYRPDDPVCWWLLGSVENTFSVVILNHETWTETTLHWLEEALYRLQSSIGKDAFARTMTGAFFNVGPTQLGRGEYIRSTGEIRFCPSSFGGEPGKNPHVFWVGLALHEMAHRVFHRGFGAQDAQQLYMDFVIPTEWGCWFWGIWIPSNPGTGPTWGARNTPSPEEDMAETVAVMIYPPFGEYPVTEERKHWFFHDFRPLLNR
jgi:hypothetical protein